MRRFANWALGGDPPSSSSSSELGSEDDDVRVEVIQPRNQNGGWGGGAFFTSAWRASTPPPPPPANFSRPLTKTTPTTTPRTTHDAVREYLDGVAAAPAEVEISGGPVGWPYTSHAEDEADAQAEAVLEAMVARVKGMQRTAPAAHDNGCGVEEREVPMEEHFQNRLDALAAAYRLPPPVTESGAARAPFGTSTNTKAATPRRMGRDVGDATPPPPPPTSNALLWLVKAVFARSSPVPAERAGNAQPGARAGGHGEPHHDAGATSPPAFEITVDPHMPQRGLGATTPPTRTRAPTAAAGHARSPERSPTTTSPPVAQRLFDSEDMLSPFGLTTATATATTAATAGRAFVTPREKVLDELDRLATMKLPDMVAPETHAANRTQTAIRARFDSFFADTTDAGNGTGAAGAAASTTAVFESTAWEEQLTSVASVTITTEEPDVAQQIARLSERYLDAATVGARPAQLQNGA